MWILGLKELSHYPTEGVGGGGGRHCNLSGIPSKRTCSGQLDRPGTEVSTGLDL